MRLKSLLNKRVYITGGSSGIGLETARQACRQGAQLVLIARDSDKLDRAVKLLEAEKQNANQRIETLSLDVSDSQAVTNHLDKAVHDFGTPDCVVANAGVGYAKNFDQIPMEDFDQVIRINLFGVVNVVNALLPSLKQSQGKVVIVGSMAGLIAPIGYTAYATSKFALVGFAQSLRPELKDLNIGLSLVCPPEVDTPFVIEEAKTISPETRAMKNMVGTLPLETAGRAVIKAMKGKSFMVVPGFRANATLLAARLTPGWINYWIQDLLIRMARGR